MEFPAGTCHKRTSVYPCQPSFDNDNCVGCGRFEDATALHQKFHERKRSWQIQVEPKVLDSTICALEAELSLLRARRSRLTDGVADTHSNLSTIGSSCECS